MGSERAASASASASASLFPSLPAAASDIDDDDDGEGEGEHPTNSNPLFPNARLWFPRAKSRASAAVSWVEERRWTRNRPDVRRACSVSEGRRTLNEMTGCGVSVTVLKEETVIPRYLVESDSASEWALMGGVVLVVFVREAMGVGSVAVIIATG
jgi:hypothetical protein